MHKSTQIETMALRNKLKSSMSCYAVRFHPGEDLVFKLKEFVNDLDISAAFILTCVGSLKKVKLRLAGACAENKHQYLNIDEKMEIVSLVGTLSSSGAMHLHISLSDEKGTTIGGHLMSDGDAIINVTAEVVLGSCDDLSFTRQFDDETGFKELQISPKLSK